MWIVRLALRRPYTFIVLALLIALLGVFTILRTPTDIFPDINIPVVATVWRYSGLSPDEMATRLILGTERGAQTSVNDVEHTESQSLNGIGVVKYFFQPNASEELSYAQITAVSQTGLASDPPGTTPPFILAYNASTVPVLQLALSSEDLSEATIFDLGNNIIRTALATVQGASMPWPYGGLQRQVQIDLDPDALHARGLSGNDVIDAIAAQNLILPAGTQKIGDLEYFVEVNSSPKEIEDLNNVPVASRNGGAHEIALPALVSTLAICIVFVPMFMLAGIARFLFVPLAEAVVFAMLASYLLSRTLVPTLAKYWLREHQPDAAARAHGALARFQARFEQGFVHWRDRYHALLERALSKGSRFAWPFLFAMAATAILAFPLGRYLPGLGQDFFPSVDGGQIRLHLRARTGLRIDKTAALCDQVEDTIRSIIPPKELVTIVDNIGVPYSGINLTYSTSAPIGPSDADIYVTLAPEHHPSGDYIRTLRAKLPQVYPSTLFTFPPADIVSQILNFGLPAPLDIQITGFNVDDNRQYANLLLDRLRTIPGAVDLRIHQVFDYPKLEVNVDRSKSALLGVTERDVASNLLVSLSGSFQTTPSFWVDPKTGTEYNVAAQTPQYRLATLNDLAATPLSAVAGGAPQLLANLATFRRTVAPGVVSHYDATPVIDIYGSVQDTDLGFVAAQINRLVAETRHALPRGSRVIVRGQIKTMTDSFHGLLAGLAGAVVLIYLLIVVNFQSWRDPFIIITALPAALAGIVWMLFLTHTPVSVPALTGAIMCMGVATANSVLVVSFARDRMNAGDDAPHAALTAGFTRFRPVLMTALAMIIGMVPMALGLGEGGEQNAPLGRAVIGGLIFATVATLFFVPTVFVMIHGRKADGAAV